MFLKRIRSVFRKDEHNWYLLAVIILSLIWSLLVLWPKLSDYYRFPGDVRTFYWMAKFQDPALFPFDDFLAHKDLVELNLWGKPLLLYPTSLGYGLLFYAASLPPEMKRRGVTTKYILKKALEPHLPREIIYRSKHGFQVPIKDGSEVRCVK